jgi:hypothetical protein
MQAVTIFVFAYLTIDSLSERPHGCALQKNVGNMCGATGAPGAQSQSVSERKILLNAFGHFSQTI